MTLNERELFESDLAEHLIERDANGFYINDEIQNSWERHLLKAKIKELKSELEKAKAQAVPEGYVLVNSESLLFHAQSIRMFNDGDWENHYEEIEKHVCAIEEIVKPSESGAEG
ncbi:hypothetical protein [Acinetobacter lactucae]|uniref:hypothetical protein n=1 Tax=Acinetobacter lactucae TaxID=1785128 RepID=UPI0020C5E8FB|nr:hypothetical protein [Acinetobacter lactucae]